MRVTRRVGIWGSVKERVCGSIEREAEIFGVAVSYMVFRGELKIARNN